MAARLSRLCVCGKIRYSNRAHACRQLHAVRQAAARLRTALADKPVPADFNDMAAHVALALWTERTKPLLNGRDA